MLGYLRETKELAIKAGNDTTTGLCRTGLDEYLNIIFPDIHDWMHDKITGIVINGKKCMKRPDYRSATLRLIIEYNGLPHYQNPNIIQKDLNDYSFYEHNGYKLIRIPYFIQLTKDAIYKLFNVEVDSNNSFPDNIASLSIKNRNTPAFLCTAGIQRMASEFKKFPDQLEINLNYLELENNDFLTGVSLLKNYL